MRRDGIRDRGNVGNINRIGNPGIAAIGKRAAFAVFHARHTRLRVNVIRVIQGFNPVHQLGRFGHVRNNYRDGVLGVLSGNECVIFSRGRIPRAIDIDSITRRIRSGRARNGFRFNRVIRGMHHLYRPGLAAGDCDSLVQFYRGGRGAARALATVGAIDEKMLHINNVARLVG